MKRTKKFLTMALAGVMMMGAVVAFVPAPKAEANSFCHAGAGASYIGLAENKYHSHTEYGATVKYQCKVYRCAACNKISIVCPSCGEKVG